MMKTKWDNDMIDSIGVVHVKTETELSRPIWSGAICDEN